MARINLTGTLIKDINRRYPQLTPTERRLIHDTIVDHVNDLADALLALTQLSAEVPAVLRDLRGDVTAPLAMPRARKRPRRGAGRRQHRTTVPEHTARARARVR